MFDTLEGYYGGPEWTKEHMTYLREMEQVLLGSLHDATGLIATLVDNRKLP